MTGPSDRARRFAKAVVDSALSGAGLALGSMRREDLEALIRRDVLISLAKGYDPRVHGGRFLLGPTGIGKSAAAVAVLRSEAGRHAQRCEAHTDRIMPDAEFLLAPTRTPAVAWARALDLPLARLGHGLGEGEAELVERACSASFLVLDDLGWESRRAQASDVIGEVIARRYDAGAVTLVTSGLTLEEITERYGDAFVRRVCDAGGLPGKVIDVHPLPDWVG